MFNPEIKKTIQQMIVDLIETYEEALSEPFLKRGEVSFSIKAKLSHDGEQAEVKISLAATTAKISAKKTKLINPAQLSLAFDHSENLSENLRDQKQEISEEEYATHKNKRSRLRGIAKPEEILAE